MRMISKFQASYIIILSRFKGGEDQENEVISLTIRVKSLTERATHVQSKA